MKLAHRLSMEAPGLEVLDMKMKTTGTDELEKEGLSSGELRESLSKIPDAIKPGFVISRSKYERRDDLEDLQSLGWFNRKEFTTFNNSIFLK